MTDEGPRCRGGGEVGRLRGGVGWRGKEERDDDGADGGNTLISMMRWS